MAQMTHWKKLQNPNYLGAYAFQPSEEKTVTIHHVTEESVIGMDGKREMCTVAYFAEQDVKPLILNVTNCKAISSLYKTPYIEQWEGKRIILKVQTVKAFGEMVDAVRVKPEIPKNFCTECKAVLKPYGNMTAPELAVYTKSKYGRILCSACAAAAAAEKN